MDLKKYFDRVILINLKRRPDRLARLREELRACDWPFKWPQIFAAVDGNCVPSPDGWQSGGGAWGCMRSHQQILEKAMIDGVKSLLILEDDACFADGFKQGVEAFLRNVPEDWDQLMLGGQHITNNGTPSLVKPGILRCFDCERTHCYAIRGEFLRKLYQRWLTGGEHNGEVHCDWIMGRDPELQRKHNVYAPERFLVGQERGKSDINGAMQPRKFWNPPATDLPVINLHAPRAVLTALRQYGIHNGYNRDEQTDIDNGLMEIFHKTANDPSARIQGLATWLNQIQWEIASESFLICTVWHPEATEELVKKASTWPVYNISANSLKEALLQMSPKLRRPCRPSLASAFVIHLDAPKRVMDALRKEGWHNGYWRDRETGYDKGILRLCENPQRAERISLLADTVRTLQKEAEHIQHGVAVIWYPELDPEIVKSSTISTIVKIKSKNTRDAIEQWNEIRSQFHQLRL